VYPLQLASGRPKLVVRPPQPAVEGEDGETRPARAGGLEALAPSLRIGRQQVLELLLDKFYDKRWVHHTAAAVPCNSWAVLLVYIHSGYLCPLMGTTEQLNSFPPYFHGVVQLMVV
jgi:hypothetical protein